MGGGSEDNSMVGKTFPHAKAALADKPVSRPSTSVAGRMFLAVICGGLFGLLLSVVIAPGLAVAFAIGGAMTFGAGTVALTMKNAEANDEYSNGKSRTEEDVRQALAVIEARKK